MSEQPSIPTAISEPTHVIRPTTPKERIQVIDILRGFAIFGILVVDMLNFSGYAAFPERWTAPVDQAVVASIQFFFRFKFVTLFSALFGLGFFLQTTRAESRGINFLPIYLRRLFILLIFGSLHVLLDPLEVLHQYALTGAFLLLFRSRSNRTILIAALVFLLLPFVLQATATGVSQADQAEPQATQEMSAQEEQAEQESTGSPWDDARVYSEGTFGEVVAYHARQIRRRSSPVGSLWMLQFFPFFLLGLYVGRCGILEDVAAHLPLIRKLLWWGLALGVGLTSVGTVLSSLLDPAQAQWASLLARVAVYIPGVLGLSLFYASAIVLVAQRETWKRRLAPLAAVGRMALTNYLAQTLICTSIFLGYGLGFYGTVGPAAGLVLTIVIYAFQVVFSVWWVGRFRFGPAEWLWRTLTYAKLQPMRLRRA